jgi:hypothetical protein
MWHVKRLAGHEAITVPSAKNDHQLRNDLTCEMSKDGCKVHMSRGGQAVTCNLRQALPKGDAII